MTSTCFRLTLSLALGVLMLVPAVLVAQGVENPPAATLPGHEDGILITSQTEPSQKVDVPSVIRGQLVRVNAKEGQPIKAGDEIAQLDDSVQMQTVALARLKAESTVEIRAAETQVAYAKNELSRYQSIAKAAGNETELRQRELAVKQSELALEQKKEEARQHAIDLQREIVTLDHMSIRSPLSGSVLRVNKQAGELVDADKPLAVVVDTSRLSVRFFAPKQVFGRVRVGDKIHVTLDLVPEMRREVTVVAVDPILDAASQLFQVRVELPNADQQIPAGTTATWVWKTR